MEDDVVAVHVDLAGLVRLREDAGEFRARSQVVQRLLFPVS
ncbi:MAG: hypothetical protein ACE5K1_01665 [Acidiferrobacterales bacterium]